MAERTPNVVTSENLSAFHAKSLDIAPKVETPPVEVKTDPAPAANAEKKEPKVAPPKADETETSQETQEPLEETPKERKARESRERWQERTQRLFDLERENAELKAKLNPPAEVPDEEPDPSKYTDIAKYRDDLKKWERAQVLKEQKAEEAKREAQRIESEWTERVKHAAQAIPDFQSVLSGSNVAVPGWVRDAIKTSEVGPNLLYHLAKNPEEAEKINKMTPVAAVRYIGKLETALENKPSPEPEAKTETPVQVSNAPAPITPVRSAVTNEVPGRNPDGTWKSLADYKAARAKGYKG